MLSIGSVFGHGFGAADVARMERLGFAIRPEIGHYAGAQVLRFIDFKRGPPLELIEVASKRAYEDFVPKGMVPYSPGINLNLAAEAERTLSDFREDFADLRPYTLHANYDDTPDPGKPGWNYLNFEVPVVPGVFLWLTLLDEPRPAPERALRHPNGAKRVGGLYLDLEAKDLAGLARLVGAHVVGGALRTSGLTFWTREAVDDPPEIRDKRFSLQAVVVEVDRPDLRMAGREGARRTTFLSKPAVHIPTNPLSWDLLLTTA